MGSTSGTSEDANKEALGRLVGHRKEELASRQLANQIIKDALSNTNDPNPAATARAKIQEQITTWKAQQHTTLDLEVGTLKGIVDELKAVNSRAALNQYLTKSEQDLSTLAPHADLKKSGGPQ